MNTMIAFNKDHSLGDINEAYASTTKIKILQDALFQLGLPTMKVYQCNTGKYQRNMNLRDANGQPLNQGNYPGTILKTPNAGEPCK